MTKIIRGETHQVEIVDVTQVRLDGDAVKKFLGEEKTKEFSKEVSYKMLKTGRLTGDKPKFEMPKLDNATPSFLIDELGKVREQIKHLEKYEGIYKEALQGRIRKEEKEKAEAAAKAAAKEAESNG